MKAITLLDKTIKMSDSESEKHTIQEGIFGVSGYAPINTKNFVCRLEKESFQYGFYFRNSRYYVFMDESDGKVHRKNLRVDDYHIYCDEVCPVGNLYEQFNNRKFTGDVQKDFMKKIPKKFDDALKQDVQELLQNRQDNLSRIEDVAKMSKCASNETVAKIAQAMADTLNIKD